MIVKVISNNRLIYNYNINLNECCIQNICRVTIAFFYKSAKTSLNLSSTFKCAGESVGLHIYGLNDVLPCLDFVRLRGLCHF